MKRDGFAGRYIIKIGSSVILAALNALIQLILPRTLSVEGYAYYSYNLNVFTAVVVMANLSGSSALASKYSKRNDEFGIVKFYLKYVAVISCVLNIGVLALCCTPFSKTLFHNQTVFLVILGLNAAVFNKLLTDVISMYDAQAISRFPAIIQIGLKIAMSLLICAAYYLSSLDLKLFYIVQIITTAASVIILVAELHKDSKNKYENLICKSSREYISEFWDYCKPLIVVNVWSQLNVVVMNWVLMNYAGEKSQAMFGVALQLNVLLAYVFSPYAELLKREFAIVADHTEQLIFRFKQALRQMYWVTAYFSIFVFVFADWTVLFLFGEDYLSSVTTVRLMMIYTLYQAWGQVAGSYYLATEQTKKSAVMSGVGLILTLFFVYVFQIPNALIGDSLGSVGIALNYSLTNLISTIISVCFCFYLLGQKQIEHIIIQLSAICECGIAAILVRLVVNTLAEWTDIDFVAIKFLTSGIIYTAVMGLIVMLIPEQMGISREKLKKLMYRKK